MSVYRDGDRARLVQPLAAPGRCTVLASSGPGGAICENRRWSPLDVLHLATLRGARVIRALRHKLVDYFRIPPDRRQYFDEDVARDQWDLLETAALLQVTEFKVFELAYKEWYGAAGKQRVIEAHFRNYMFNQAIPVWVARFCRRIVEMGQAGTLDPREFGIYPRLPSRRMMLIGKLYVAMLLLAFLVLLYLAYGQEAAGLIIDRTGLQAGDTGGLPQHNTMP